MNQEPLMYHSSVLCGVLKHGHISKTLYVLFFKRDAPETLSWDVCARVCDRDTLICTRDTILSTWIRRIADRSPWIKSFLLKIHLSPQSLKYFEFDKTTKNQVTIWYLKPIPLASSSHAQKYDLIQLCLHIHGFCEASDVQIITNRWNQGLCFVTSYSARRAICKGVY